MNTRGSVLWALGGKTRGEVGYSGIAFSVADCNRVGGKRFTKVGLTTVGRMRQRQQEWPEPGLGRDVAARETMRQECDPSEFWQVRMIEGPVRRAVQ